MQMYTFIFDCHCQ